MYLRVKNRGLSYNTGQKCWDTYQNTSEQSTPFPPPPPSPQEMLSSDDQTHIYTRKNYLTTFVNIVLGGGEWGGGGDYAQTVPLQITIVVPNDSLVIFWTVFTSVPTTFDLHCRFKIFTSITSHPVWFII